MTPQESLQKHFGFDAFRPGQEEVVSKLLDGRSVLAVFPTGAGKSLCFQLPALELDALTLVVSPLIALMKDQLDFLRSHALPAARLDSSLSKEEVFEVYDNMDSGMLKILYVSPERLQNERFVQRLKKLTISMLVIDEAHCISEWGHNFRPDYLKLAGLAKELKVERVLGLTATATPEVATDIRKTFDIADEDMVHTGFHRPNLDLVMNPQPIETRLDVLNSLIEKRPGASIVYVTLQKTAESVAAAIPGAKAYHAGMQDYLRAEVQDWFMSDVSPIVVATIAFGMGIDKADIRYVYHYNLSKSLENYAQEIGRAGRDGKPSICETLAYSDDLLPLENFIYGDTPTSDAVSGLVEELLSKGEDFDISMYELSGKYDVRPLVVKTLMTYLELDGVLKATQPFYSVYKFVPNRSSVEILKDYKEERATFLKKLFAQADKAQKWFSLDLVALEETHGMERSRVVAALDHLEGNNDIQLKVSGIRNGFRRLKHDVNTAELSAQLMERFRHREQMDLERVHEVLDLLRVPTCTTQFLLAHFGEEIGDCKHCGRCRGEKPAKLPTLEELGNDRVDFEMIDELKQGGNVALKHPRQIARFLCGISSPASTKARITRNKRFGSHSDVPFMVVLEAVDSNAV